MLRARELAQKTNSCFALGNSCVFTQTALGPVPCAGGVSGGVILEGTLRGSGSTAWLISLIHFCSGTRSRQTFCGESTNPAKSSRSWCNR